MTIHLDDSVVMVGGIIAAAIVYLVMTIVVGRAQFRIMCRVSDCPGPDLFVSFLSGLFWPITGTLMVFFFFITWRNGGKS